MNSYERIYNLLIEGATTGANPLATGVRVGNFTARRGANVEKITNIAHRLHRRGWSKKGGENWKKDFLGGVKLGMRAEQRRRVSGRTTGPFNTKTIKDQPLN